MGLHMPNLLYFGIPILIFYSWLAHRLVAKYLPYKLYHPMIFFGVIIHEIGHIVGCILTGAKIKKISLFKQEGDKIGEVIHSSPKVPVIGQCIISLAPIFSAMFFFYILTALVHSSLNLDICKSDDSFFVFFNFLKGVDLFDIRWLFLLYATLSMSLTLAPSSTDLKHASVGVVSILLVILALEFIGTPFLSIIFDTIVKPLTILGLLMITVSCIIITIILLSYKLFEIVKNKYTYKKEVS